VPRPDTETVVELALEMLRAAPAPISVAHRDIGTGSGAIYGAITELPDAHGSAADISEVAVTIPQAPMPAIWNWPVVAAFIACDYAAALSARSI